MPTNQKRPRLSDNDNDDNDDMGENNGSDKLKRTKKNQTKKAAAVTATAVSPLIDGGAAAVLDDGNALLFFSNFNARDGKLFVCPSFDVGPHVIVDRKNLRPVDFDTLADDKRKWYLHQLQADILKRFDANAASLFASSGSFMINVRQQLLQNPANADALMQSFVDEADKRLAAAQRCQQHGAHVGRFLCTNNCPRKEPTDGAKSSKQVSKKCVPAVVSSSTP